MSCTLREEDEDFPATGLPELVLLKAARAACLTASLKASLWKCKNLGKVTKKNTKQLSQLQPAQPRGSEFTFILFQQSKTG